jgi:hypothetical protein
MVIKETILHSGWSYGNGDDQYDNESLGSTRTVFISEKLMENSSSNNKNQKIELIGSRNKDKHTEEYGWTKIGINSNRKPKTKNETPTPIDSVIATININPEMVQKGAPKAQIDSPIRNNRCTISDDNKGKEGKTGRTKEQEKENKQIQATVTEAETRTKPTEKIMTTEAVETNEYEKGTANTSAREDTRNNNVQEQENKDKKKGYERKKELTRTSTGEECKDTSETTNTNERSSDDSQKEMNKEIDKNKDKNNKNTEENNRNNNNKTNNNEEGNDKNNNNKGGNKPRVNILEPEDMNTYSFTVSWRPDQKKG